jgi:hypothetical protein
MAKWQVAQFGRWRSLVRSLEVEIFILANQKKLLKQTPHKITWKNFAYQYFFILTIGEPYMEIGLDPPVDAATCVSSGKMSVTRAFYFQKTSI